MSNPVSALQGKAHQGDVSVREDGLRGMITLRGDLSSKPLRKIATAVTGVEMPDQGRANVAGERGIAWMSPDEALVMVPHGDVADTIAQIDQKLKGTHFLAVDVSDARAVFHLRGPSAREVIAKLAPLDLHPDTFGPGDFRRSRLGQIAAAVWMEDDGRIGVMTFRSTADYAFSLLVAAAEGGPVGHLKTAP